MEMKKKVFVLTICSSCEYGCNVSSTKIYLNKSEAHRALKRAYHEALDDVAWKGDEDEKPKPLGMSNSFQVSDYECSYDCVSGKIEEVEMLMTIDIKIQP